MNVAKGYEDTEATVTAWEPAVDIDWDAATGPVRPPLAALAAKPAEWSH